MKTYHYELPLSEADISVLRPGDRVFISGEIFTARDQAHKRLLECISNNLELPIDLASCAIFYCGPSPTPTGKICGAIGPTTSSRMDFATPTLIEHGLRVMIGKGERSEEVSNSIRQHGAVYLTASGGIAALLSKKVVSCETWAWSDLGTEAIFKIKVIDFPLTVALV